MVGLNNGGPQTSEEEYRVATVGHMTKHHVSTSYRTPLLYALTTGMLKYAFV